MAAHVRVRRTGGFVGRTVEGSLDLTGTDFRVPEARDLVDSLDLAAAPKGKIWPDMYVYTFEVDDQTATVPENLLTPALRRLSEIVLDPSR